jgi:hypothetical protein
MRHEFTEISADEACENNLRALAKRQINNPHFSKSQQRCAFSILAVLHASKQQSLHRPPNHPTMPPHAALLLAQLWDANASLTESNHFKEELVKAKPQEKSVDFSVDTEVHEITALSELSEGDMSRIWYRSADFERMKQESGVTLEKAKNDEPIIEEEGHCMRGLEGKTKFGARRRRNNKLKALDAVWTQQISLWRKKMEDPIAIANALKPHSLNSKFPAMEAAIDDEKYVIEHVRSVVESS